MTETIHTVARDALLGAFRHVSVAAAAGISAGSWVSRVLAGDRNGYIGVLHRGRIPAIEIYQAGPEDWTQLSRDQGGQGITRMAWRARIHVGGADQAAAEALARFILYTGLIQARAVTFFTVGNDSVGTFTATALGYALEVTLVAEIAMGRADYDMDPSVSPIVWLPGGIAELTFDYDSTSPALIFAVPAGAVVSNVALHVVTAFDGVGATATVGTDADPSAFLGAGDTDLSVADSITDTAADEAGPVNVSVTVNPGTGATQGQLTVQVTIALAV